MAKNYKTKDAVRPICYAPKVAQEIKLDKNRDSDDVVESNVGENEIGIERDETTVEPLRK